MPTVLSHPAIPITLALALPSGWISPELAVIGIACSVLPDIDVIGFGFGIHYGDLFGHRGFTHSFSCAIFCALMLTAFLPIRFSKAPSGRWCIFAYLLIATASHGILDALTNGGLGVAFFSPFSNTRYFFPWRPIDVSPIGITAFFSPYGFQALASELRWIWLPCFMIGIAAGLLKRVKNFKSL